MSIDCAMQRGSSNHEKWKMKNEPNDTTVSANSVDRLNLNLRWDIMQPLDKIRKKCDRQWTTPTNDEVWGYLFWWKKLGWLDILGECRGESHQKKKEKKKKKKGKKKQKGEDRATNGVFFFRVGRWEGCKYKFIATAQIKIRVILLMKITFFPHYELRWWN